MNYYTNLALQPIHELHEENETILINSYVTQKKIYLVFKKVFDFCFSVFFIIFVLSWLLPVVALAIYFDSRGPVFFIQKRIGKNGKIFSCLKFRTMIINEEADEKQASENDERITRIGKFLRKTNIDEFPQFLNVLMGDMSIIGPRPHMISDCTRFSFVIPAYKFRTLLKPGITGLAQVKGYRGPTIDYETIFARYHYDAEYIRNLSFWLDLKIIFLTMFQSLGHVFLTSFYFVKKKMI